ncbi:MAG TPA: hypothetical protein VMW80_04105 [Candidatus Dormibacteraeota bacterium]|nr:hypothetical protein [Candidatus Dormibacteraeota bacterium]
MTFCVAVAMVIVTGREFGTQDGTWVALWLCPPVVGAVTAALRPRNAVGWILLAIGVVGVGSQIAYAYSPGPHLTVPEGLVVSMGNILIYGAITLFVVLILVFPSGHAARGWRRQLIKFLAVTYALILIPSLLVPKLSSDAHNYTNPLAVRELGGVFNDVIMVFTLGGIVTLLIAAGDAIRRLRHATGVQRQQLKWLAYASALFVPAFILVLPTGNLWWSALPLAVATNGVAASIGLAIVRYRLYDIDRLVSRTVSYLIVVGLLFSVYVACVLLMTTFLPLRGSVSVVIAVLIAVALFAPVRSRARSAVDKRFNRSRYDAQAVVDSFASRIGEQVTLDAITADLLAAVDQTVQPSHTSLWLRGP